MLGQFSYRDGVPPGELYLFDTVKSYGRPGRDDMGIDNRFKLIYFESSEV